MALALTMMAANRGAPVPDGLHIMYPPLLPTRDYWVPSILSSWEDLILTTSLLMMAQSNYAPTDPENFWIGSKNCYLSPL